nr:uncharacterized protein LOC119182746 [Rhipicephalus microplus]
MTSALQFVQTKKIKHFGILKIYGTDADLQSYGPALLKKTTAKLRSVIPASEYGKSSHIIFGFGYYSYDFKDSYNTLKATVTKLTSDDVTVVVIITCVLTVRSLSTCKAMPASAWDPKNNMMSSMKNTIPMKTTSFATNAKIVAFAFQMGVLNYHMPVRFMKPEYAAYQRCTRFAIGSMPESCEGSTTKLQSEKVMAGINTAVNRTFFITFDSLDTMKEKADLVMSSKDRKHKFTWFLFNVHLTDVTNVCFTPKPGVAPSTEMQRLKKFREFYYAESQKYISG